MALGWAAFKQARRKTVRAPINPMDRCTIFSIFPKQIHEVKLTLQPGEFIIPPGSYEAPASLVVGPSSWWRDVGEDEPLLEIPHSSAVMAESVVNDWMLGLYGVNDNARPGVFWLPGEITVTQLKTQYKAQLEKAKTQQTAYYVNLIKLADNLWARTNGNPLAIAESAKLAARELEQTRDWVLNYTRPDMVKCVACGSMRNPDFPICPTCKAVVDIDKAKKLNLKFAE